MTLKELKEAVENRRRGMGYFVWRLGSLSQWLKEYPKSPEDACPELYPEKKGIPMPDFLKEKYFKRKVKAK